MAAVVRIPDIITSRGVAPDRNETGHTDGGRAGDGTRAATPRDDPQHGGWREFGYGLAFFALLAAGCTEPQEASPLDLSHVCHVAPLPPADLAGVTWERYDEDGGAVPCGHLGEPCCAEQVCDPGQGVICARKFADSAERFCAWAALACR